MSDVLKDLQALSDKISGNHDGKVFGGVNAYLMCVEPLGNVAAYIEHLEDNLEQARIKLRSLRGIERAQSSPLPVTSLTALRNEIIKWVERHYRTGGVIHSAARELYEIVGVLPKQEPSTFTPPQHLQDFTPPSVSTPAEAQALLLAGLPNVPK